MFESWVPHVLDYQDVQGLDEDSKARRRSPVIVNWLNTDNTKPRKGFYPAGRGSENV